MLAEVDISLLTATAAIGRVSGPLEFIFLPRVGETVSLCQAVDPTAGFSGHLVVEHVIHTPNLHANPMLSLSDIIASSAAGAKSIGVALGEKYGLFFEPYGD